MAPAPRESLKDLRLQEDGIHILWADGHESFYPHRYLRAECRCAACVHELTGKRLVDFNDVAEDVQALDWLPVGRYALQLLWSDTHSTGIYPFTLLRRLCQCPSCKARGAQSPTP